MTGDERLRLHVLRSGKAADPDTPTFVLLHGFGASSFSWRFWMPALERRGRVLRVDLLGFGSSPKPAEGPYAPHEQARLVHESLTEDELHRVVVIGHSLGGGIALLTALRLLDAGSPPERLVVVAGAAYAQRIPPFVRLSHYPKVSEAAFRAVGARLVVRQVARSVVFDPTVVDREFVEGYVAPLEQPGAARGMLACAANILPLDLDAVVRRYRELDMPALLLWGRHDRVVPRWVGERLERDLPRARLHVLEQCGHIPHEECPGASLALLEDFLDS